MIVLSLLLGCKTEFYVDKPSCGADYLHWNGGITEYMLDGGDGGGDFDYDPPSPLVTRAFGIYELTTGTFAYDLAYDEDHWRVNTDVEGYGYAATNGDLDVEATWSTTDVLDNETDVMIRETRIACDVERRVLDIYGQETVTTGRYRGSDFEYEREEPTGAEPYVWEGTLHRDFSYEESLAFDDGALEYNNDRQADGEGNSREDWTWDDGTSYVGFDEFSRDGGQVSHWDVDDGACTVDYAIDYSGNGDGEIDCGEYVCEMTFVNGRCTCDWNDGTTDMCFGSSSGGESAIRRLPQRPRHLRD